MDKIADLVSEHKQELAIVGISTLAVHFFLRHQNKKKKSNNNDENSKVLHEELKMVRNARLTELSK